MKSFEQAILRPPKTAGAWNRISLDFEKNWNLPHCVRAIDA